MEEARVLLSPGLSSGSPYGHGPFPLKAPAPRPHPAGCSHMSPNKWRYSRMDSGCHTVYPPACLWSHTSDTVPMLCVSLPAVMLFPGHLSRPNATAALYCTLEWKLHRADLLSQPSPCISDPGKECLGHGRPCHMFPRGRADD